jgi:pimeloyl-ACP methyl ester carboxylesterase
MFEVVKNIVLVHGAFADGSSWSKVIPLLQEMGYHAVVVQNPMTSLADEVAFTKRIIALQDGPVILVGHSYRWDWSMEASYSRACNFLQQLSP